MLDAHYQTEMLAEDNARFDAAHESHSALDPLQELAYDNGCSVAELRAHLARVRPAAPPEPDFHDPSVPF
jgi:hypothetical protein